MIFCVFLSAYVEAIGEYTINWEVVLLRKFMLPTAAQFATQMQSDIHSLRSTYQSFRSTSEAWWADHTNRLSNLSATTHLVSQTAQTLTTTTHTIAQKVSIKKGIINYIRRYI